MRTYYCIKQNKQAVATATNPVSALKKTFRSPPGWHWDDCEYEAFPAFSGAVVVDAETNSATFCKLYDNG